MATFESSNYNRMMSCFHGSTPHVNNAMSQFLKNAKVKACVLIIVCFSTKEKGRSQREDPVMPQQERQHYSMRHQLQSTNDSGQQHDAEAHQISCLDLERR